VNVAVDLAWYQAERGHEVRRSRPAVANSLSCWLGRSAPLRAEPVRGSAEPPVFGRKDPVAVLREAWALRRAAADFQPDVVHAHMVTER